MVVKFKDNLVECITDKKKPISIDRILLPLNVEVGSVIKKENGKYIIDTKETIQRKCFPWRLVLLRAEKEMNQETLAKSLGYGSSTISNYESGKNDPGIYNLIRLAEIFAVSVDYLIGYSDNRSVSQNLSQDMFADINWNEKEKEQIQLYLKFLLCLRKT